MRGTRRSKAFVVSKAQRKPRWTAQYDACFAKTRLKLDVEEVCGWD
jgi:hypothetical protein